MSHANVTQVAEMVTRVTNPEIVTANTTLRGGNVTGARKASTSSHTVKVGQLYHIKYHANLNIT